MEISEHQFPNLDTRIKKRFKKGEEVVVEVQRGRKHFKGSVSKNWVWKDKITLSLLCINKEGERILYLMVRNAIKPHEFSKELNISNN